jgi:hypothetical protein
MLSRQLGWVGSNFLKLVICDRKPPMMSRNDCVIMYFRLFISAQASSIMNALGC